MSFWYKSAEKNCQCHPNCSCQAERQDPWTSCWYICIKHSCTATKVKFLSLNVLHDASWGKYLHILINHEIQAIEIKVANLLLKAMFDTGETVCHYLLHTTLKPYKGDIIQLTVQKWAVPCISTLCMFFPAHSCVFHRSAGIAMT